MNIIIKQGAEEFKGQFESLCKKTVKILNILYNNIKMQ